MASWWQKDAAEAARISWADVARLGLVIALLFAAHRVGTGAWWL